MKVLAIVGSPRPEGNTNYLVDKALEGAAKSGVQTEKILLSQHDIRPCLGHDDCANFKTCTQQDDASWVLERFCEADGVILATPVYWYNMTAQMKTFVDRNYFIYRHDTKPRAKAVGLIIVAEGAGIEDTLNTMRKFVDGIFPIPKNRIITATGYANKMREAEANTTLVKAAVQLGRSMAGILLEND